MSCILLFTALYFLAAQIEKRNLSHPILPFSALLVCGLIFYNSAYFNFFETSPSHHLTTIQAAIFMNIFASHLLTYKLAKIHNTVAVMFILAPIFLMGFFPEKSEHYKSFALWGVIIFVFFWYQRRYFVSDLYSQYQRFLFQYSPNVARAMIVTGNDSKYISQFVPTRRPCVCICIDWRSFQEFSAKSSPEIVEQSIARSHELLLDYSFKCIQNQTFHADWSADEFFITIYSDSDEKDEILQNSWSLISKIQESFYSDCEARRLDFTPTIDIGAGFGICIVGLLGPHYMRKLTAIGNVGGRAKRYETEAKEIRKEFDSNERTCFAVFDEHIFSAANQDPKWKNFLKIVGRTARTKDIADSKVFLSIPTNVKSKTLRAS
jgi:hypothetical protein